MAQSSGQRCPVCRSNTALVVNASEFAVCSCGWSGKSHLLLPESEHYTFVSSTPPPTHVLICPIARFYGRSLTEVISMYTRYKPHIDNYMDAEVLFVGEVDDGR